MTAAARAITIYEVGPRDGLQNEPSAIATVDKVAFVDALTRTGVPAIEVTAFVSSRWVPAMADAEAVMAGITKAPGIRYTALVPNQRGFERAATAGVSEVATIVSATETFNRRNLNASIDESLAACGAIATLARRSGIAMRAYLSTAFGCPFEGSVRIARVVELTERLLDLGAFEVAVSDTIGVAHPGQVRTLLSALVARVTPDRLAMHFHDTYGMAAANVAAALEFDITTFDASAGGLGGCPYAPGATGNLATQDLCYLLDGLGRPTGVDATALDAASRLIEPLVGHSLPSRVFQARQHRRVPDLPR